MGPVFRGPTTLAFSDQGHRVSMFGNVARRGWELEPGVGPLFPIRTPHERVVPGDG